MGSIGKAVVVTALGVALGSILASFLNRALKMS